MASISEEFSGECFDFDFHCLSASCLQGVGIKAQAKRGCLLERKDVLAVFMTKSAPLFTLWPDKR